MNDGSLEDKIKLLSIQSFKHCTKRPKTIKKKKKEREKKECATKFVACIKNEDYSEKRGKGMKRIFTSQFTSTNNLLET